tara:strand:+ start:867 stop:1061 length:195 start_codon:yes stop_codon:yes gene_type:complete
MNRHRHHQDTPCALCKQLQAENKELRDQLDRAAECISQHLNALFELQQDAEAANMKYLTDFELN